MPTNKQRTNDGITKSPTDNHHCNKSSKQISGCSKLVEKYGKSELIQYAVCSQNSRELLRGWIWE